MTTTGSNAGCRSAVIYFWYKRVNGARIFYDERFSRSRAKRKIGDTVMLPMAVA